MTKLEIKIWNQKPISLAKKEGAYLATFERKDDRILIYCCDELRGVIDADDGHLFLQTGSAALYTNLKKIKKMKIEVELE